MGKSKKIIYIQYTNPGGYPPLIHSSHVFANKGWQVLFFGVCAQGEFQTTMEETLNIRTRLLAFRKPGLFQKLHYVYYCIWVLFKTLIQQPDWIYASDCLVCPLAWMLSKIGFKIIYHEHDSPNVSLKPLGWNRVLLSFRKWLADEAKLCILPNKKRAEVFLEQTGRREVLTVWNCPATVEIRETRARQDRQRIVGLYHGSIVPSRLPLAVLDALAQCSTIVKLRVVGYETVGHQDYIATLLNRAKILEISERIEIIRAVPRGKLFDLCVECDFGLAFMPMRTHDINMQHMTGASNKPFDYLACGLALLVADLPDWTNMYVKPGYGLACNPEDPDSIAHAFRWYIEHPQDMRAMGEKGRRRILSDWNYENHFSDVLKKIEGA